MAATFVYSIVVVFIGLYVRVLAVFDHLIVYEYLKILKEIRITLGWKSGNPLPSEFSDSFLVTHHPD